jgi:hypothetical protein
MSLRTIISLAASAVIAIAFAATAPTDAFAHNKKGVHHRAVAAPPAAVVAIDNGPPADHIPRCFDSAVYYPLPPCY